MSTKSVNIDCNIAKIHASKLLTIIVLSAYLVATLSLVILIETYPMVSLLVPLLWLHGYYVLRLHCLRLSGQSIVTCRRISQHAWYLCDNMGKQILVKRLEHAYCSPYLIVMTFQTLTSLRKITVVIAHDALPKQNYTHLLARLLYQ